MTEITISPIPAQSFKIVLGGQYCTITVRQKGNRLYLDMSTPDNDICAGAVCVNGADVLQSPSPYFFGSLHFFDTIGDQAPYFEGLNDQYVLLYVEADETLPVALQF